MSSKTGKLKLAKIIPVFKKTEKNSLLPLKCYYVIFDYVIFSKRLLSFLSTNNTLSDS